MDEATKAALLKLANGYVYEDRTVVADGGGKAQKVTVTKKHVPPSLEAIKMIEQLRLAGKWRD